MKKYRAITAMLFCLLLCFCPNTSSSEGVRKDNTLRIAQKISDADRANYQKEIDKITGWIAQVPGNAKYYAGRGEYYFRLGEYSRAIEDFSKAISINPSRQDYFEMRAGLFVKCKNSIKAKEDFTKAITIGPPRSVLFMKRSLTEFFLGNFKNAEIDAESAIKLKAEDIDNLSALGMAQHHLGKNDKALATFTKAITLSPRTADLYQLRSETYSSLGKLKEAKVDSDRAKALGFAL